MRTETSVLLVLLAATAVRAEPVNLHNLPADLRTPAAEEGKPAAGKRVRQINPGCEEWEVAHTLYLPTDWKPDRHYPVIFEYAGNGGYRNNRGDVCTGRVEDCNLGYGISGGRGFIWVCLPFVDPKAKKHALNWWGDPDATVKYCKQTIERVCKDHGGDPSALILTGFSRGAIACSYIGLRDDDLAKRWFALIPHSHYDGVTRWPYADSDRDSALKRIERFKGRPQFITHETSVEPTRKLLKDAKLETGCTFVSLPFVNHTDTWVLRDLPERKQLRDWLEKLLAARPVKVSR